jgi:hypothetical protein
MTFSLKNELLKLEILEPGTPYTWPRFDWMGMISQVTYKNTHTFCTTETRNPWRIAKRGIGLSNEFGIEKAVGYADCKAGERFPKIGIGLLLKKPEKNYRFFKNYDLKPFPFSVTQDDDTLSFICKSLETRGYAAEYIKTIKLVKNKFTVRYELRNTGAKPISTNEYNHNFVSINKENIGPEYVLKFSFRLNPSAFTKITDPGKLFRIHEKQLAWNGTPKKEFFIRHMNPTPLEGGYWALEHTRHKVGIKETCVFPIGLINLWGKKHVTSPEIFFQFSLAPGEATSWQRVYEIYEV